MVPRSRRDDSARARACCRLRAACTPCLHAVCRCHCGDDRLAVLPPRSIDVGVPIQSFGMIVAAGVLIGAALLRRYAEWHGVSDEHIRGLTGWIMVAGFLGAHEFDVIAYQWDRIGDATSSSPRAGRLCRRCGRRTGRSCSRSGTASRRTAASSAARSASRSTSGGSACRSGCSPTSRSSACCPRSRSAASAAPSSAITSAPRSIPTSGTRSSRWTTRATLNLGAPRRALPGHERVHPGLEPRPHRVPLPDPGQRVILWLAFRPTKRTNAGLITVARRPALRAGPVLPRFPAPRGHRPAPLRPDVRAVGVDPRVRRRGYVAVRLHEDGKPAEVVAPTSGEAQRQLKMILKEEAAAAEKQKKETTGPGPAKGEAPSEAEDKAAQGRRDRGRRGRRRSRSARTPSRSPRRSRRARASEGRSARGRARAGVRENDRATAESAEHAERARRASEASPPRTQARAGGCCGQDGALGLRRERRRPSAHWPRGCESTGR